MLRKLTLSLCALALCAIPSALAHSVWIEPGGNQLVIRFAEPGDDFETSPGYLDNLSLPVAFMVVSNQPTVIESAKKSDHFSLEGAAVTNVVCAETSFTVRAGRMPLFYARWQPAGADAGKPLLTLDLVPTGKPGEVRLYLRGQPKGGAKAKLLTPKGDEKEFTADAGGYIRFPVTEPGQYLLTVAHQRESLAGVHLGVPYTETSHNCSLVWEQK